MTNTRYTSCSQLVSEESSQAGDTFASTAYKKDYICSYVLYNPSCPPIFLELVAVLPPSL